MSKNDHNIQMRLISVSENSYKTDFSIIPNEIMPEELEVGFCNHIIPPTDGEDTIILDFGVRYCYLKEVCLDCNYKFTFEVIDLSKYIETDQETIKISNIMPHLISVAIGTMRGILVIKTSGTKLSNYPIPMLDPNDLLKNLSKIQ